MRRLLISPSRMAVVSAIALAAVAAPPRGAAQSPTRSGFTVDDAREVPDPMGHRGHLFARVRRADA